MRFLKVKTIFNKKNGQTNFYIPKRKLSKELKKNISNIKSLKIKIEGYDLK